MTGVQTCTLPIYTVDDAIALLAKHGKHVVVKLGSKGAMAIVDGKRVYHPGFRVEAKDTTGAGDSFNAGYVYGYLMGMEPAECLVYGNACGALSVSAYGGSTGTMDHGAMQRFIAEQTAAAAVQWEARG